ncbi:hypothetical protein Golax_022663, partial [Gossypium laxum]|nr:hypothetical protein [Gossypium laxum]
NIGYGPHRFFWRLYWKLRVLPKIHVFAWRIGHKLLPTNVKISSINRNARRNCPRWGACDETVLNTLKDCSKACDVLMVGGFDNWLLVEEFDRCIDWIEDTMRVEKEARLVWDKVRKLSDDFRIHNLSLEPILPRVPRAYKWEKPLDSFVNINMDASVMNNKTGLGIIIRDSDGFVIGCCVVFKGEFMSLEWGELDALFEGLRLTRSFNLDKVIFKRDCAIIVNRACKHKDDIAVFGFRIKEARKLIELFTKAEVK